MRRATADVDRRSETGNRNAVKKKNYSRSRQFSECFFRKNIVHIKKTVKVEWDTRLTNTCLTNTHDPFDQYPRPVWPIHVTHLTNTCDSFDQYTRLIWPIHVTHLTNTRNPFDQYTWPVWPIHVTHLTNTRDPFDQYTWPVWPIHVTHLTNTRDPFDQYMWLIWPIHVTMFEDKQISSRTILRLNSGLDFITGFDVKKTENKMENTSKSWERPRDGRRGTGWTPCFPGRHLCVFCEENAKKDHH